MSIMKLSLFSLLFAGSICSAAADVISLTDENFDSLTAGKTVFLKYFAPWCGHCKNMAADWEKLAADYDGNESALVAEVDCTADDTEQICDDAGIQGFPTLKYGDASALEDYDGGRDYMDLSAFAKENLKPMCSPFNIHLCDADKKAIIEKFQKMSSEDLEEEIEKVTTMVSEAEDERDDEIEKLQEQYHELITKYDSIIKDTQKASHFSFMKAVLNAKGDTEGSSGSDEL